ncbi:hypothetical protein MTO96_043414 [Rhipicephalus appendiculatus]
MRIVWRCSYHGRKTMPETVPSASALDEACCPTVFVAGPAPQVPFTMNAERASAFQVLYKAEKAPTRGAPKDRSSSRQERTRGGGLLLNNGRPAHREDREDAACSNQLYLELV